MFVGLYVCIFVCLYVCIFVCLYVCMFVICMYVCRAANGSINTMILCKRSINITLIPALTCGDKTSGMVTNLRPVFLDNFVII